MSLRLRLLSGFVLVAVPPVLLLAAAVTLLVSRSFEVGADARLDASLDAVRRRIDALRSRAASATKSVAASDLPAQEAAGIDDRLAAEEPALRRDLQVLEVVAEDGRVVSSAHWPAGFGLPDRGRALPGDDTLRLVTAAEGYGDAERLALAPQVLGSWRGTSVVVRGGFFVDRQWLEELQALVGADVALCDLAFGRSFAAPGSLLEASGCPAVDASAHAGQIDHAGTVYRWRATPLAQASTLWIVAATPRTPLDRVQSEVRRATLAIAGAALAAALLVAAALSSRIARPVAALAEGARRVAEGDLEAAVEAPSRDELGQLAGAFNRMTAGLRAARERLVQAERVAAWRELARRLAHELKNPLFPIQVSIETLQRAQAEGRDVSGLLRDSAVTILDALRSLRRIVDEFGDFARMPRPRLAPLALDEVVEQVLALYGARAGRVHVEWTRAEELPLVDGDRDQLARALGNLVANALEAMPDGGTLRVRTSEVDGAVSVEVEDTGPGLSPEQRERLFAPYYTTKPGGTGLGLAIVQGIVSDHGGRIDVRSEPGRGTAFTIRLRKAGSGDGKR
jgi:nitrogen fixation/metabolism regulation signal transduction histidine kinase